MNEKRELKGPKGKLKNKCPYCGKTLKQEVIWIFRHYSCVCGYRYELSEFE